MKKDARAIVVLGMHRGGTSVLARALQTLGVSGGDSFLDPNEWNPKGYFEHPDIVRLNDILLSYVGKRWDSLALPLWKEWEPLTEPYQTEAVEILESDFGKELLCGIKDPRVTRILPFWQSAFRRAGLQDCYIVALRNPISVARSLAARNGFTSEKSYLLWVLHMFAAIRDTEGKPRIVVDYDALIAEPRAQLERIAATLELPITEEVQHTITKYADSFLSHSLRHSVHDSVELRADPRAGELVGKAYGLLCQLAQDNVATPEDRRSFKRQWGALGKILDDTASIFRYLDVCEDQIDALTSGTEATPSTAVEKHAADAPTASLLTSGEDSGVSAPAEMKPANTPAAQALNVRGQAKDSDLRVSVVIPLYNHERYIESAIESVFAQSVRPAEIIIVDDGSTDGSVEKVRQLCKDRPDVIFWSRPNQGAHHTLNAAIHRATGDFVAILNSDDRYDPERLAACLAVVQSHPEVDVVATQISFMDERGRGVASQWYENALAFYKDAGDLSLALFHANFLMTTSNLFIRRAVFESVGYFSPLRYAHDLEFFLRLMLEKKNIYFLERPLLTYRFHAQNTIAESKAGTDVERAAVLAFFLYRYWLVEGTSDERESWLKRYVEVLAGQGIAEMVEYFLASLRGRTRQEGTAAQESVSWEFRGVLSRLGIDWAAPKSGDSLLAQFVAARNISLRKGDALSTGMSKHAAEVNRLHRVLAEKDRGLQEQAAEIHRVNKVLVAKDVALTEQAAEIHRLNDVVVGKDEAHTAQVAEFHRLNDVLVAKDGAHTGQAAEIHRINQVLVAKDEALTQQAAEIHRIHDVLVAKDEALREQAAEIHRMEQVLVAKDEALTQQAAEIHRINDVLVAKDKALREQAAEIHRINRILLAKDVALTEQAAEIHRMKQAVVAKDEAFTERPAEIHRMERVLVAKDEALTQRAAEIDRMKQVLASRDEVLAERAAETHRMKQVLVGKDAALTERAAEIHRLNDALVAKDKAHTAQAATLHRMNRVLAARDEALTEQVAEIRRLHVDVAEKARVASEHRETILQLSTGMEEQRQAVAELTKKYEVLEAGLTERERELASLRQTSWYKLGQAWNQEGWSINKIGRVTYHFMRGVTPETLKRPVRPLVARVKRSYQGHRSPAAKTAERIVKPHEDGRARRPRVLHVIGNFMLGGSSRLVVDLIDGFGEAYEQKVVTSFLPSPPAYNGIDVTEFRSPQSLEDVLPFLLEYHPSLVHVHYWGDCDFWWYDIFFRAVQTLGCRVIENVNTPVHPYQADFVDRYVYVSSYVRSNFGKEVDSRNLTIYPGSDFSLFSRRGNRQLPSDCIGMVYRLEADKLNEQSIDAFIKVAQRRPQTKVIIVGGGIFLEPYQRAVQAAGVEKNFVFTGYVDYSKLPELYERMSIFVAPVWQESFGQVSSFAMSMGIPVAGYNVGGLAEIVEDTSLLAAAGDSDELATLVVQLLDDPERCRQIGARNRDRALALFSVEAMLDAYRRIYGELLAVDSESFGVPG